MNRRTRRRVARRWLAVIAFVLLAAGPLAASALHETHDDQPCEICRLVHAPAVGPVAAPTVGEAAPGVQDDAAAPLDGEPVADGFACATPPRGPPA